MSNWPTELATKVSYLPASTPNDAKRLLDRSAPTIVVVFPCKAVCRLDKTMVGTIPHPEI